MASIEQPVQSLSGGNQQKVSLTRPFLRGNVSVILAEEPTQGVDVAARFDIYDALRAKAKEGVAIVVKSSDPLELAGLCDRVVVMSRGRIVDEIRGEDLGERRIVEAIVGSRATPPAQPLPTARDGHDVRRARGGCGRRDQVPRRRAARPDDDADPRASARTRRVRQDAFLTSYNLQQPAARDDAARARLDGADVRAARRRLRRLGRRPDDAVRRRRLVHDDADDVDPGADPGRAPPGRHRARGRSLQRAPHPRLPPAFDHRHARHAQHPPGCVALAARLSRQGRSRPTSSTR